MARVLFVKRYLIAVIALIGALGLAATQSWIPGLTVAASKAHEVVHAASAAPALRSTAGGRVVATAAASPAAASAVGGPAQGAAVANRAKLTQTRAAEGQVQNELDLAMASAARVQAEVDRLDAAVAAQQRTLDGARSSEASADREASAATRGLTDANGRLDQARSDLRAWAVRAYMHSDTLFPVNGVGADINELGRGQVMLSMAVGTKDDVIDVYRQDQRDQLQATAGVRAALSLAQAQTRAAADEATKLLEDQQAQQAAQAALQKRIADLRGESVALAAQEKSIEALIASEDGTVRTALASLTRLIPTGKSTVAGLIWPVHGPVTSEFGPRWGGFHPGIDIAAAYGTPIQAAKDGVVIFAGWNGGYGNFVLIDHGGGIVTGYAHQSRIAVARGQIVHQGDVIGYEGSTGYSTGPHVHFEVRNNGIPQNPRNYEQGSP